MCVDIETTEVNVDFIRLHLGHQCEVTRMVLLNDERACIAGKALLHFVINFFLPKFSFILHISGKLDQGVPLDRILGDIRKTRNSDPEEFDRIHYTEKKDIRNIQQHVYKIGAYRTSETSNEN